MSNESDTGGQPAATTTISTIAVQAGDSQIIVTVFKCEALVQLQLTEANPNLLEIGSNQDETKKLLHEHEQLLIKLKKHEAGVWALLEEADRTAEEKEDEREVYEAMAVSLSDAWRTMISLLEKRRSLLHLTSEFFDRALEFAIRIDEAEEFQSREQELADAECLKELLMKHSVMKRGLLEKSMLVLNKSRDLLDFLREFQTEDGLQRSKALRGADSSYGRVESLMEILQDRRRQVDQHMKQQLIDLEVILNIYQWDRQEQEVTHWFKNKADLYFEKDHLGSALTENEELLQEYKEFEEKAKDWSVLVEKLLAQASELQVGDAEGCAEAEMGHVSERSVALKALHNHFWNLMMGRLAQLQESNSFFSSANTAFEVLGSVESKLKGLKTQTLWLPELAKKHEDLLQSIKESANDPLQRGQLILQKAKPQSTQVEGVKRMLGYVRDRVDALSQECHAHQALAAKRQQLVSQCEDLIDKISVWLKSSNGVLSNNTEPGSLLSQSEDMLNKHLELSSQTQQTASEAEAMAELIKEVRTLGCPEAAQFSNKASLVEEELKTVTRNITSRIENIQPYVGFLRIAEEVEEQMQSLHESYNRKQEEEENEESLVTSKGIADAKWQSMLERFLTMLDLGNNYINFSNMVSENLNLNVRAAIGVVEKTMEELNKKKVDLSDLWTSMQLHVSQLKSVKKQWKKYKEQLEKTVHDLNSVEEVLVPTSKVDLGSDLQTVSKLLENFNLAKPHFLQLNAGVEYMVKTSELLALKGITIKEKNEKVTEMLHLHQRVKDKIKEYESVLNMAVKFHQLYDELDKLSMLEPVTGFSETSQAKIQLIQHQDRQSHIRHLYKLAISLGGDISNTVQQLHDSGFSVQRLQERLERLERRCVNWSAEANRCEESLTSNVYYCVFKEEITELRKSFKDLKKKFNNLKFNYMKKNDKSRNLKAVKNQIQQIEIYVEKLQILQKRVQVFTVKVTSNTEKQLIGSSPREIEDAVNELQRQLGDFDKTVEEYKQNLDMSVKLQQAMDEYNFWCDEASATIVRVGKYSSQCKTREAVSILYKQFEKFVWPTVPQQEERISQITELAVCLHGAEEGNKYTEKTVTRHNEIVESIKELSNGLMDLEAKLQTEALKQEPEIKELDNDIQEENKQEKKSNQETERAEMYPQESLDVQSELKETGHTPELTMGMNGKEVPIKIIENTRSKKPQIRKTRSQELPDKLHPQHHNKVLSESRYHTRELCSETSRVETITSRLTMERKDQLSTSFSCTQTFNLSCSPLERDRKVHTLNEAGIKSLVTPPPTIVPPIAFASAPSFSDIQREFQKKERQGPAQRNFPGFHTSNTDQGETFPQDASLLLPPAGGLTERNLQRHNLMTEESLSNDEYECTSPDDISLPPLSETPESNIVLSENDLDLDGFCLSSQSHTIHINQYSHQLHSTHNDYSNSQSQQRIREQTVSCPSPTGGLNTKFRPESSSFVHSPLTVPAPSLVSNTLFNIMKSRGIPNLPNANLPNLPPVGPLDLNECHQTVYSVHESSVTETQEKVHDPSTMMVRGSAFPAAAAASTLNTHATPSPLTTTAVTLTDQGQDPDLCNPTAIREEIRLPGTSRSMGSTLAGQGPPHFSKLLSSPTVMEGSPVTLEVEVTGFPEPTLTWFKNGEKLTNDEHIELSQKEGKHALFIQKVTEADAGLYVCGAVNSSGTLSSSAALQVNAGNNRCPDPSCPLLKLNWHTCFGTLCFLLYLLYLLLL